MLSYAQLFGFSALLSGLWLAIASVVTVFPNALPKSLDFHHLLDPDSENSHYIGRYSFKLRFVCFSNHSLPHPHPRFSVLVRIVGVEQLVSCCSRGNFKSKNLTVPGLSQKMSQSLPTTHSYLYFCFSLLNHIYYFMLPRAFLYFVLCLEFSSVPLTASKTVSFFHNPSSILSPPQTVFCVWPLLSYILF